MSRSDSNYVYWKDDKPSAVTGRIDAVGMILIDVSENIADML